MRLLSTRKQTIKENCVASEEEDESQNDTIVTRKKSFYVKKRKRKKKIFSKHATNIDFLKSWVSSSASIESLQFYNVILKIIITLMSRQSSRHFFAAFGFATLAREFPSTPCQISFRKLKFNNASKTYSQSKVNIFVFRLLVTVDC